MEDQEEENNKSKQEQNQIGIKSNESIEIRQSNKSSEKDKEKENLPNNEEIKTNEQNDSKKSLTAKEYQNQDNKDKETASLNLLYQGNNSNNDNNEDITNIKYVSQNQIDKLKREQNKKNRNESNPQSHIITLKDLQQNPNKKLLINSTRSLRALYDSGITLDQIYHKTMDEFIQEHKEVLHLDEETRLNRYHFYEKLRMDKINNLVEYREKLIQDEIEEIKMNEAMNNINNKNEDYNEQIKPMKNIILDNDKRIAREEIDIMQKQHEKELANIIQLELDKDLFNLDMQKQQEKYAKEYQKLNFLNFNLVDAKDEEEEEKRKSLALIQAKESSKNNYKSLSLPKKPKIFVDPENTYLDNLHSLQQTLINQKYEKKQKKVAQKLERLEKVRKITAEQRTLKKRIGEERAAQNLQKNAIDFNRKHEDLIKEIQNKKINIFQNKRKFENITKNKNELNNLKYIVKLDHIEDLKKKDENLRNIKYLELMEKQSKVERIKNDRSNVVNYKILQKDYLNEERRKNIIKIRNILNNGISEENLEKIIHQFPQNQELLKVINDYKTSKAKLTKKKHRIHKTENDSTQKRPQSQHKLYFSLDKHNIYKPKYVGMNKDLPGLTIPNILNDIKSKTSETDKASTESNVKEKIKLYKNLLYKQFYEKVQREKKNEEMRLQELDKIVDKNYKYQLEKKFRKERAVVYMRLERENQKINEKISAYELKLKNSNNKI